MPNPRPEDIQLCREHAEFFRLRGYCVLPGSMEEKKPLVKFKELWNTPAPASLFDQFPTTNLHVMTGKRWRLLVIDLDGPEAQARWPMMGRCPDTWRSHSGGNGLHVWFSIPSDIKIDLKFGVLWRGQGEHNRIDRICEHGLIIAPPSIHVKSGKRYVFDGNSSPARIPMPAQCPQWVLNLKPLPANKKPREPVPQRESFVDIDRVLDKTGLAISWGLRPASTKPDAEGWISVRAIDREDARPSASFNVRHGFFIDHGTGVRLTFADLAVALNAFPDVRTALVELRKLA